MGRPLRSRTLLIVLAFGATFVAGAASQRWLLGEARADSVSSTSTIYVPSNGLVFRTLDGKPIARISHDARGGVFELYDEQQQPMRRAPASGTSFTTSGAGSTQVARDPGF
jgi:hypothetical protein